MSNDRIPNRVIAVLGHEIGTLYSHTRINTLFQEAGFPGEPPAGNCIDKSQTWIRRANQDEERPPLVALGELLAGLTIKMPPDKRENEEAWSRIETSLAKCGLRFDGEDKVTAASGITPNASHAPMSPSGSRAASASSSTLAPRREAAVPARKNTPLSKVFLVHGHDKALKNTVARFLETLGLEVVILHERADNGDTVVEKLTRHADADFAVVLLTADDEGRKRGMDTSPLRSRARQNVVLEFGIFLGRLTRQKVCAIVDSDLEMPSDMAGILYVPRHDWQKKLLARLQEVGLEAEPSRLARALRIE